MRILPKVDPKSARRARRTRESGPPSALAPQRLLAVPYPAGGQRERHNPTLGHRLSAGLPHARRSRALLSLPLPLPQLCGARSRATPRSPQWPRLPTILDTRRLQRQATQGKVDLILEQQRPTLADGITPHHPRHIGSAPNLPLNPRDQSGAHRSTRPGRRVQRTTARRRIHGILQKTRHGLRLGLLAQ